MAGRGSSLRYNPLLLIMKRKDVYKIMVVVFGILFIIWGLTQYSAYHGENNTSGYGSSVYATPWQGATPGSICYVHVKADKDVRVQIFSTADMRTETKEVTHTSYSSFPFGSGSVVVVPVNESDYTVFNSNYGIWVSVNESNTTNTGKGAVVVPITNFTPTASTYITYETKQIPVAEKTGKDVTLMTVTSKTTTFYVNVENPDENSDESIKYTLDMVVWAPNYLLILIGIIFILSAFVYSWIKSEPVIHKIKKDYPVPKIEKKIETPVPKTFYIHRSKLKSKQDLIR